MARKQNNPRRGRNSAAATPAARAATPETPAPPASARRKWLFRALAAVALPLLLLTAAELVLRLGGYGYATEFFKPITLAGRDYLVENDQFGLRFFPPALARVAPPVILPAKKAADTIRIFILGESAALGDPRPNYGAGRYLETLLRARFPERKFEVVNTGITAINSHAILPIARECARYQGDAWILYMGNNEMVGPFGAATVFGAQAPPLPVVRLNLWLQETRVGQLLVSCASLLRHRPTGSAEWRGMEMFRGNQVPPHDPRRAAVYRNFEENLNDILRAGSAAGAAMVLSTVAVNLKDCPPFSSVEDPNSTPTQAARYQALCREAEAAREQGDYAAAAGRLTAAADLGPLSADREYRLGECLLRATNSAAAALHFQRSLDADALPFRADSRINGLLIAAGKQFAGQGVALCDAAAALAAATPDGVPGEETFFEHVHLNFNGNYLLGREWAAQIQRRLADRLSREAATNWLSQEQCERRLGLTDWNRASTLEEVAGRIQQPPFTDQLDHDRRLATLTNQLADCRAKIAATPPAQAVQIYEAAVAGNPQDYRLHENFAEFLEATHDPRATQERQKVCELIPHFYFPFYRLGLDLEAEDRLPEALQAFTQAANLRPAQSEVRMQLGSVHARLGQWALALAELERARRLNPDDPHAFLYSAEVLWKLNRRPEALASVREAVRLRPEYWEAHYRLGDELAQQDDVSGAAAEFEQVVRLNPSYVKAHSNLAVALYKLGHLDEAQAQFDEVLRLEPQNRQALEFKQHTLGFKSR